MDIKTNSEFDLDFEDIEKQISNLPIPQNFERIYDLAIRYVNKFGLNSKMIEKVYLIGYINGKKDKEV